MLHVPYEFEVQRNNIIQEACGVENPFLVKHFRTRSSVIDIEAENE